MLSDSLKYFFQRTAELTNFTLLIIRSFFRKPFESKEFIRQSYSFGYKSLGLICITALIMGLVLTLQTRPFLSGLGADSWLPGMVFISVVKEIGPVITALIFSGKVGSGIGAELSSMRVTEQIDAMEISGTYPIKFLVTTRVLATTLMLPILVIFADFMAFLGSFIGINMLDKISFVLYFNQAFNAIGYDDLLPAIFKTFFFGFAIGVVSCFIGYNMNKGTEGVGKAANSAVVLSSLIVFIIDLLAVQITEIVL